MSKSVQSSSGRCFDKGGLERRTFFPVNGEPGTSFFRALKIEVGHFGFVCFPFVNMLLFFKVEPLLFSINLRTSKQT